MWRLFVWPAAAVLLLCALTVGQQDLVVGIDVTGNRRIPAETIKARIYTRAGDIYDPAGLERDFNSLWNTGYFEDIRFEREQTPKGWLLHVIVKERPTIREITYTGLNSVSTSDVLEAFKHTKVSLSPESQYDPTKVKKAEVVIRELLASHGRQYASVRTEVRPIPPSAVGLTFVVKEGPKVKVGTIRFQGNKNVNSRVLRHAMKNLRPVGVPHSIFLENLFSKTYDGGKLEEDTEHVREEFQNRGYYKVVVQDADVKIHDTGHTGFHIPLIQHGPGKTADINIPVEEGDHYRLGGINFKNNKAVTNVKVLRAQFPIKDGDVFSREKIAKGLENLRKAYGTQGYINFTSIPTPTFDEDKKVINLDIDIDEGKQFFVRRIEFQGNTTTRDKVIRREIALEEGQQYNQQLWEFSILRLNQLGYFDQIKADDPGVTERHINEKDGTVDLTLKLKEKGKNSIGLSGGVSGLSGSFVGINYQTNNFLGLGETLTVQVDLGTRQRDLLFGFTEPYMFDRPLQLGFQVYTRRFNYNQLRETQILSGQQFNVSSAIQQNLQNYTQNSDGFSVSLSYPLRRSLKRLGITYSFDRSSLSNLSDASKQLFTNLAFSGFSGPNQLDGIVTSKIFPSYSYSTLDSSYQPRTGRSIFLGAEIAGLGGTVRSVRPLVEYKRAFPMQNRHNAVLLNFQGSFITGFGGVVSPPFERFYEGGEYDLRGFDLRTVSPVAFLPDSAVIPLENPDGSIVPLDPNNPRRGSYNIPIPAERIVFPGGDASVITNLEYRISIAGPVTLAPFVDAGIDPIIRKSQLRINTGQLEILNSTKYGCPALDIALNCVGQQSQQFSAVLSPVGASNWTPRMSTGIELQVLMPVLNAPFRIYYAYNPLRLDTTAQSPVPITRGMFPAGGAGDFTHNLAVATFAPKFDLREPRRTFRFTVGTTF
jgi:outer membrane protein insertion porin family